MAARTPPFGALLALFLVALLANNPAWAARDTRQSSRKSTRVATPVTVALLPFSGPGAEAQRKQVRAALQKRKKEVRVLPASTVDAAVASAGAPQSEKQRQELARRLDATALVTGQVSADRKQLVLEVASADTGKVLTTKTLRLRSASATQQAVWPQLSKALLSARPPSAPPPESPPPSKSPDSAPPDAPSPTPPPPPAVASRPPEPPPPPRKSEPKASPPPQAAPASTEATASTKSTGAKPVVLEVVLGGGTQGRRLGYTGEQAGLLLGYELLAAPSGRVSATFFPGALRSRGVLAHLGLHVEGTGTRALSTTPSGALFSASVYGLAAGLVGRVPLGASELLLGVDYGQQTFAFQTYGSTDLDGLPDMDYHYVRGGLGGRVQVTERLAVLLDAAFLAVLRTGELGGPDYFPRASANGLEGALSLGFSLNPTLELRLGGQYRRYLHTLNAQPEDARVAGGAVDEYFTVQLGLATRVR